MAIRRANIKARLSCLAMLLFGLAGLSSAVTPGETDTPDPRDLIRAAMEHWRGVTSYSEMTMTIHRSDWERSFSMHPRSVRRLADASSESCPATTRRVPWWECF